MSVVLVTGAGGFVGSAIVRLMVNSMREARPRFSDGAPVDHVVALLRPEGSIERLKELLRPGDWSIEHADLADRRELQRVLQQVRPRAIIHAALDPGAYRDLPDSVQHRLNIRPLESLFEGLRGTPGARFIHAGSAWVLPAGDRLDESVCLQPRSAYARCKAQIDQRLPTLGGESSVPWINLRLFNIFGKYEKPSRLLPYLVSRLAERKEAHLSHGNQVRDFNDVDDIAQAFLLALEAADTACNRVYHIGSGRGTTTREFALNVAELTGNAGLARFDASDTPDQDLPCLVANPALARRILGWSPAVDLKSRIHRAVNWWLDRGASAPSAQTGTGP